MNEQLIQVLVADCNDSVRRAVRIFLSDAEDMTVAGEATCGRDIVEMTERLRPDVALVDCSMPDLDCLEIVRQLKALPTTIAVIVLDTYGDRAIEASEAGASAYLLKDDLRERLLDEIRRSAAQPTAMEPPGNTHGQVSVRRQSWPK